MHANLCEYEAFVFAVQGKQTKPVTVNLMWKHRAEIGYAGFPLRLQGRDDCRLIVFP